MSLAPLDDFPSATVCFLVLFFGGALFRGGGRGFSRVDFFGVDSGVEVAEVVEACDGAPFDRGGSVELGVKSSVRETCAPLFDLE